MRDLAKCVVDSVQSKALLIHPDGQLPSISQGSCLAQDGPVVFETRWALSYLRGPLTREQIRKLTDGRRAGPAAAAAETVVPRPATNGGSASSSKPVLPPEVQQFFIPARAAIN